MLWNFILNKDQNNILIQRPKYALNIEFHTLIISILFLLISHTGIAQTPKLGQYNNAIIQCGQSLTIIPSAEPENTVSLIAIADKTFTGILVADPISGLVKIENPYRAGVFEVTLIARSFNGELTHEKFNLTVHKALSKEHTFKKNEIKLNKIPTELRLGDFNKDGFQDLALLNTSDNSVSIYTGNDRGDFKEHSEFKVQSKPVSMQIGDFNGDNNLDIVVCNNGSNSFSICLGNGSGEFENIYHNPVGEEPNLIEIFDFNRDGILDFVITNQGDKTISIILGDLLPKLKSTKEINMKFAPIDLKLGYFNDDEYIDIAVLNLITNNYSELNIYKGDSLGDFKHLLTTQYDKLISSITNAQITASKIFQDGREDLIGITNSYSDYTTIFLLDQSNNYDAFSSDYYKLEKRSNFANNIFTCDINGNENELLAILCEDELNFYNLANPNKIYDSIGFNNTPNCLGYRDFNQDGILDMVCTFDNNNSLGIIFGVPYFKVRYQNKDIEANSENELLIPRNFSDDDTISIEFDLINLRKEGPIKFKPLFLSGLDTSDFKIISQIPHTLNTDKTIKFRLKFTLSPGTYKRNIDINIPYLNDSNEMQIFSYSIYVNVPPHLGKYKNQSAIKGQNLSLKPINGIKYAAYAKASTSASFKGVISVDPSTGQVNITNCTPPGTYSCVVHISNSSKYTLTDTFELKVLPTKNAFGNLACKRHISSVGTSVSSVIGDFNKDGHQDLAQANFDSSLVIIFEGSTNGDFKLKSRFPVGFLPSSISTGDFNEDGFLDLVTANYKSQSLSILQGFDNFEFKRKDIPVSGKVKTVIVKDLNNDNHLDLTISNLKNDSISILLGNGQGNFNMFKTVTSSGEPFDLFYGDFNKDGQLDIGSVNFKDKNLSISLLDTHLNPTTNILDINNISTSASVGDINNDGILDIITNNIGENYLNFYKGILGGNFLKDSNSIFIENEVDYIKLNDLNSDENLDLLGLNTIQKMLYIFYGNGDGHFDSIPMKFKVNIFPKSLEIGDFNQDNYSDIAILGKDSICIIMGNSKNINVYGNNKSIFNHDENAKTSNATFFPLEVFTQSYTIKNLDSFSVLQLEKNAVNISGNESVHFKVVKQPNESIPALDSSKFTISFTPQSNAILSAHVNLQTKNCRHSPFEFRISANSTNTNLSNDLLNNFNSGINIYPNPSNGKYTMELRDFDKEVSSYEVTDILGHKIQSKTIISYPKNIISLDLTTAKNGTYFLRLNINSKVFNYKLIKISPK